MRKFFMCCYVILFAFIAVSLLTISCTQDPVQNEEKTDKNEEAVDSLGKTYELDLSKFGVWGKEQGDTFNPATGELIIKEGYGGSIWLGGDYTGEYNYLEIKNKNSNLSFDVNIKYDDETETKFRFLCQKQKNVDYIEIEPKKITQIEIWKHYPETLSTVLESFTLVQEKPNDNINPIVDIKTGKFDSSISAIDLAKQMKIGWNLANSLDVDSIVFNPVITAIEDKTERINFIKSLPLSYIRSYGLDCELAPYTTKEIINFPKTQGYATIRIPVTWYCHFIDDNYTIDPDWMARVKEIVDWAMEAGHYVIIDTHNDVAEHITSPLRKTNGYMVCNGCDKKEICSKLKITIRTCENYFSLLYSKLGVNNIQEMEEKFGVIKSEPNPRFEKASDSSNTKTFPKNLKLSIDESYDGDGVKIIYSDIPKEATILTILLHGGDKITQTIYMEKAPWGKNKDYYDLGYYICPYLNAGKKYTYEFVYKKRPAKL